MRYLTCLISAFCLLNWIHCNPLDDQYFQLVNTILWTGEERSDRTGTGTLAVFAPTPFVFDVSHDQFPLLTTKKIAFRLVAEELFWMISGSSAV
ncbi:MAG: hypothetical protein EOP45_16305, partial [Sphingobacteriaceae bacterium]